MRALGCFVLALLLAAASPAQAHFVWVTVGAGGEGSHEAKIYFSETPEPGAAHLVDRLKPTEAWSSDEGGAPGALKLTPATNEKDDTGALVAPVGSASSSVAARCQYGIFQRGETSLLLNYYARHQATPAQKKVSIELPLDIDISAESDKGFVTVTWNGKPLADAEVFVTDPSSETREGKTNAEGKFEIPALAAGDYAIRARHVEKDKSGELDGKKYSQTWHIATLTVGIAGANTAAEQSATDLLTAARKNRAVWENFPGFRAKLKVSLEGEQREAGMVVSPDGDVELKGLDGFGRGFVDRHINSLVMHRMPGGVFDEGASFEGDDQHVLGRKIRLAEASMGSIYRIRDDVVTEVNRSMGKQHFTISVLDVDYNAEEQYLPHVFTVSFWDDETGNLKTTESVFHEWTRVDKFDLPAQIVVVSTGDEDKRQVLKIDFSDLELLDAPRTAAKPTEQAAAGK